MVAHYTLKYSIKSAENYLILIDSMMHQKYVSQIGDKSMQFWIKKHWFSNILFSKYEPQDWNSWSAVHKSDTLTTELYSTKLIDASNETKQLNRNLVT